MPRRSPGEIRSQLPRRRGGRHRRTVIRGLSASANQQIARFERSHGLDPGEVALAFRRRHLRARRPRTAENLVRESPDAPTDHVRTLLEHAALALRTKAGRELRAAVEPLDDRVLRRTVNDPSAPASLPRVAPPDRDLTRTAHGPRGAVSCCVVESDPPPRSRPLRRPG